MKQASVSSTVHGGGKRRGEEGVSAPSHTVLILRHVGPSAHHLIDRQRAGFGVLHLQVELPTGASSVSSVFGSTPRRANCASALIELDRISDAAPTLPLTAHTLLAIRTIPQPASAKSAGQRQNSAAWFVHSPVCTPHVVGSFGGSPHSHLPVCQL
jgi:hypothetical protein